MLETEYGDPVCEDGDVEGSDYTSQTSKHSNYITDVYKGMADRVSAVLNGGSAYDEEASKIASSAPSSQGKKDPTTLALAVDGASLEAIWCDTALKVTKTCC